MSYVEAIRRDATCWIGAGVGIAMLGMVFHPEIAQAVSVWNSSTAYGHCWLVLPIVAWLLWERRDVPARHPARPAPWAALLAIPLLLAWFVADLLGIMEGRQLAAIGFVLVLLLAALGWRLWWALSAAFLYLVFLVPFGAFLTQPLQRFTAGFVVAGLAVLNIPCEANSFQIAIPEGVFYVAEACAGLRFLIASVAFGVLYAVTMFRSPGRRAAFIAVSCVVPVVANGFRALGIVLLGHALGSAEAGAADHLIYGWVFFSTVILLLALAGLPFREPPLPAAGVAPTLSQDRIGTPGASHAQAKAWRAAFAMTPIVVVALAGPLLAGAGAVRMVASPELATPPGCLAGASHVVDDVASAEFRCGLQQVRVTATSFAPGVNPMRAIEAARLPAMAGLGDDVTGEVWTMPGQPGDPWLVSRASDTGRVSAYAIRADGVQGVGGLHDRLRIAGDMVRRGPAMPVEALAVTLQPGGEGADIVLRSVLTHLGRAPGLSAPRQP